jgi:hypothetical protein
MTSQPRDHTLAFLGAFQGVDAVYDFRAMHDRDRSMPARTWRGTFAQCEAEMREVNQNGHWGIHVVINQMDGVGLSVGNVTACRAQLLDLDDFDAGQQLGRVLACPTPPHIVVNTSAGKVQCWWKVIPHADKQLYTDNQRRLIGEYNGDVQFIDAAHTARLPGFYHHKGEPTLVTVTAGPLWGGAAYDPWAIAAPLLHVPLAGGGGDRQPLGHAPWQAPSIEWIAHALGRIDPNSLRRNEWIALTAAIKQAGWSFGQQAVRDVWDAWCARYGRNDARDNHKQWRSIDATSSGWRFVVDKAGIAGDLMAAGLSAPVQAASVAVGVVPAAQTVAVATGETVDIRAMQSTFGEVLRPDEQQSYFRNCFYVTELDVIIGPNGRLMNQSRFTNLYGGKKFMLNLTGETSSITDNAWKAATQSRVQSIPKVDHQRFRPDKPYGELMEDEFGEVGVNTYRPPKQSAREGDVTPFLDHLARLLPVEHDRSILLAWMAQVVQRPGVKIGWAPVIQSMEGAGKTLFERIMQAAVGRSYMHKPKAKQLNEGGGKFNGWMHRKLLIIINEVKCDEKRDLIEVMKEWITDDPVEMEKKGQDQFVSDNPTNWLMFTNYKDAIPINDDSRRYAVMYSAIQRGEDLDRLGMRGEYFSNLYKWAREGGAEYVVHYLQRYEIPAELDAQLFAHRAPRTSSTAEAVEISRGWLEKLIIESVDAGVGGFRNGWLAGAVVRKIVQDQERKTISKHAVASAAAALGYIRIGQATKIFMQEGIGYQSILYSKNPGANVKDYALDQGYETAAPDNVVPMLPPGYIVPHAAE